MMKEILIFMRSIRMTKSYDTTMSCRNENDVQRRVSDSRKEYLLYEKWRRSITANWGYRHIRWLSLQSLRARNYYIGRKHR